jgi:SAM-dependent methyltransferase
MRRTCQSTPERLGAAAGPLFDQCASDYSSAQAARVQADLARLCLDLLGHSCPNQLPPQLLLDVGCGSGLSSAEVMRSGHSCVGLDVSAGMLALARQHEVVLCDVGCGMPFRRCFDGAISVSALQWLVATDTEEEGISRAEAFFCSLDRALSEGAAAVCQVYTASEAHTQLLLTTARACGFATSISLIGYPHEGSAAKKLFLLFKREQTANYSMRCALAWPRKAACAASWLEGGTNADRLASEHAHYASRLLRVLRRARAMPSTTFWPEVEVVAAQWCSLGASAVVVVSGGTACKAALQLLRASGWATSERQDSARDVEQQPLTAQQLAIKLEPKGPAWASAHTQQADAKLGRAKQSRAARRAAMRRAAGGTERLELCELPRNGHCRAGAAVCFVHFTPYLSFFVLSFRLLCS